jgi:hypothetical protein
MADGRAVDDLVRKAFRAGQRVDLRCGAGASEGRPELRAETLVELLTEDRAAQLAGSGVRLAGVRILGRLRLAGAVLRTPLWFTDCTFDEPPDLRMARLTGLSLRGCRLPGLHGSNLRVAAGLNLSAVHATGTVLLNDAQIGGTLRLDRAQLRVPTGYVLFAERLEVRGALYARWLRSHGELRLPGVVVVGNVNLSGAALVNPGRITLDANGIHISGSFIADRRRSSGHSAGDPEQFTSDGRILLAGARIAGDLVFSGARIRREAPPHGPELPGRSVDPPDQAEPGMRLVPRGIVDAAACLVADRIRVEGNLEMDDGFRAHGTVRLPNALVGGYLRLSGAELGSAERVLGGSAAPASVSQSGSLTGSSGVGSSATVALLGDGLQIGGDLEARDNGAGPLRVIGQLRLVGMRVQGSASLSGVELTAPGGDALYGDALSVDCMLFLRNVACLGTIRLQGARIGASLDCSGTRLTRPRIRPNGTAKPSLDLRAATVGKDVFCTDDFHADGGIRLGSAEVGASVVVANATLGADGVAIQYAFDGEGLATPMLIVRPAAPPTGRVRLTKARVRSWQDNEALWQADGGLDLDGFDYQALSDDASVGERLRRLECSLGVGQYRPGPYEQLAAAYRNDGREEEVERVQMARQRRRYRSLGPAGRVWGELQHRTVGFGYQPWLAVAWLGLFWLLGGLWFSAHRLSGIDAGKVPVWNPWLYAADMLLPIINLGEKGYWRAEGASQWITSGLVVVGWVLATTAAQGVARVLKRS